MNALYTCPTLLLALLMGMAGGCVVVHNTDLEWRDDERRTSLVGPGRQDAEVVHWERNRYEIDRGHRMVVGFFPGAVEFRERKAVSSGPWRSDSWSEYVYNTTVGQTCFAIPTISSLFFAPFGVACESISVYGLVGCHRWNMNANTEVVVEKGPSAVVLKKANAPEEVTCRRPVTGKTGDGADLYFDYPGFDALLVTAREKGSVCVADMDGAMAYRRFTVSKTVPSALEYTDVEAGADTSADVCIRYQRGTRALELPYGVLLTNPGYVFCDSGTSNRIDRLGHRIAELVRDADGSDTALVARAEAEIRELECVLAQAFQDGQARMRREEEARIAVRAEQERVRAAEEERMRKIRLAEEARRREAEQLRRRTSLKNAQDLQERKSWEALAALCRDELARSEFESAEEGIGPWKSFLDRAEREITAIKWQKRKAELEAELSRLLERRKTQGNLDEAFRLGERLAEWLEGSRSLTSLQREKSFEKFLGRPVAITGKIDDIYESQVEYSLGKKALYVSLEAVRYDWLNTANVRFCMSDEWRERALGWEKGSTMTLYGKASSLGNFLDGARVCEARPLARGERNASQEMERRIQSIQLELRGGPSSNVSCLTTATSSMDSPKRDDVDLVVKTKEETEKEEGERIAIELGVDILKFVDALDRFGL